MTTGSQPAQSGLSSVLQRPWQDYVVLIGLSAMLGSNFLATKIAVTSLPPLLVVTLRLGIAAVLLVAIAFAAKTAMPRGRVWLPIVGAAFFGHLLPFSLISWGQQQIEAGVTAILMAVMPLFTLGLAFVFTQDEKPTRWAVAGFAVALVGIIILFGPEKLMSLAESSLRQYAIAVAAFGYGVSAIISKSLTGLAWQSVTACFMVISFLMSLPLLLTVDFAAVEASGGVWLSVLYTGVFPTALGAVLIIYLIKRAGASFISQINFLVPVFGAFFAVLLLGEQLPSNAWIALVFILAGVALARRRPKREALSLNKGV